MEKDPQQCYTDFLDVFKKNPELLQKNRKSLECLHGLLNGGMEEKFMEILETLCLIGTEDIPTRVVNKICSQGSTEKIKAPNWEELYSKLCMVIPISYFDHTDTITLPKFLTQLILQRLKKNPEQLGNRLFCGIQVLTGLFSRDNRVWLDDGHLANTQQHIDTIMKHAEQHFEVNFSMKKQVQEDFFIWMGMCKLHARLGQAYVQSRTDKNWQKALGILLQGAQRIWNVVDAYTKPGLTLLCFFNKSNPDILDFDENKNVNKVAIQIADKCLKAGEKIETAMVEQYFKSNIRIGKAAFEDFIDNLAHSTKISLDQARNQLVGVQQSILKGTNLTEDQIKQLQESGNLLSVKSFKQVFLAERMCDFFHTYGRQDIYIWKEMQDTENQLQKCKYYTELSHCIAKRVREKTETGLLFEFITTSNCKVPRSLQNRDENETIRDKLERFRQAYTLANSLLADPTKYYENGMYMATQRSTYTKLNAQKYAVKAANKMVGINENVPPDSIAICDSMLALAKDQIYLDMGPACVIMAAKFYASVGQFQKSFDTFAAGFKTEHEGKCYGIFQHFDGRINTYAWAVANHARAIHAAVYKKEQVDIDMRLKVMKQCKTVYECGNEDLKKEWKHQMKGWEELLKKDA
uniref:Uncharacterized protein LOC100180356 n=1 Tax=Phallusia mammillata TaxID=59560 RepID=A0A6F9DHY7_9ASCI|nr:uncharacterized protein LOC100180356 [Phallusia mammillata]